MSDYSEHILELRKRTATAEAAALNQLWDIARTELALARDAATQASLSMPRAQETI